MKVKDMSGCSLFLLIVFAIIVAGVILAMGC